MADVVVVEDGDVGREAAGVMEETEEIDGSSDGVIGVRITDGGGVWRSREGEAGRWSSSLIQRMRTASDRGPFSSTRISRLRVCGGRATSIVEASDSLTSYTCCKLW